MNWRRATGPVLTVGTLLFFLPACAGNQHDRDNPVGNVAPTSPQLASEGPSSIFHSEGYTFTMPGEWFIWKSENRTVEADSEIAAHPSAFTIVRQVAPESPAPGQPGGQVSFVVDHLPVEAAGRVMDNLQHTPDARVVVVNGRNIVVAANQPQLLVSFSVGPDLIQLAGNLPERTLVQVASTVRPEQR